MKDLALRPSAKGFTEIYVPPGMDSPLRRALMWQRAEFYDIDLNRYWRNHFTSFGRLVKKAKPWARRFARDGFACEYLHEYTCFISPYETEEMYLYLQQFFGASIDPDYADYLAWRESGKPGPYTGRYQSCFDEEEDYQLMDDVLTEDGYIPDDTILVPSKEPTAIYLPEEHCTSLSFYVHMEDEDYDVVSALDALEYDPAGVSYWINRVAADGTSEMDPAAYSGLISHYTTESLYRFIRQYFGKYMSVSLLRDIVKRGMEDAVRPRKTPEPALERLELRPATDENYEIFLPGIYYEVLADALDAQGAEYSEEYLLRLYAEDSPRLDSLMRRAEPWRKRILADGGEGEELEVFYCIRSDYDPESLYAYIANFFDRSLADTRPSRVREESELAMRIARRAYAENGKPWPWHHFLRADGR